MDAPMMILNTALNLHPWIDEFLKHGVIFGGVILKIVEAIKYGTSIDEYLKTGDIDVLIETSDIFTTHSYLMGMSTDTSVIIDDKYGLSTYAHYHITCPKTGYLFDVSVVTSKSKINLINPRFSVENMGIMMRDGEPVLDMIYKSNNCKSIDTAIKHVLEQKLIIVEPLYHVQYKADPTRFIERLCKKVENGWIISDDDRTKVVILQRYNKIYVNNKCKKILKNYIDDKYKYNNDKMLFLLEAEDDKLEDTEKYKKLYYSAINDEEEKFKQLLNKISVQDMANWRGPYRESCDIMASIDNIQLKYVKLLDEAGIPPYSERKIHTWLREMDVETMIYMYGKICIEKYTEHNGKIYVHLEKDRIIDKDYIVKYLGKPTMAHITWLIENCDINQYDLIKMADRMDIKEYAAMIPVLAKYTPEGGLNPVVWNMTRKVAISNDYELYKIYTDYLTENHKDPLDCMQNLPYYGRKSYSVPLHIALLKGLYKYYKFLKYLQRRFPNYIPVSFDFKVESHGIGGEARFPVFKSFMLNDVARP